MQSIANFHRHGQHTEIAYDPNRQLINIYVQGQLVQQQITVEEFICWVGNALHVDPTEMRTSEQIEYALTQWPDTRQELITREAAAQIAEKTYGEFAMIPAALSKDCLDGAEGACELAAMFLRFKDATI